MSIAAKEYEKYKDQYSEVMVDSNDIPWVKFKDARKNLKIAKQEAYREVIENGKKNKYVFVGGAPINPYEQGFNAGIDSLIKSLQESYQSDMNCDINDTNKEEE